MCVATACVSVYERSCACVCASTHAVHLPPSLVLHRIVLTPPFVTSACHPDVQTCLSLVLYPWCSICTAGTCNDTIVACLCVRREMIPGARW